MAAWLTHLIILMMFAVSWHLHFILYLPFFCKQTDWMNRTDFHAVRCFCCCCFFDLLPNTDNTTSHISFHFHIHYFRRALPVPSLVSFRFSSFFTCDRDGQLSTVKLRACVCVCVGQRCQFSLFLIVRPSGRHKKTNDDTDSCQA